jgi:hypothetical protein
MNAAAPPPVAVATKPGRRKTKAKGAQASRWLVPGEAGWEFWEGSGGAAKLVQSGTSPGAFADLKPDAVGFPACEVISFPFWAATGDPKLAENLLLAQAERRGLLNRGEVYSLSVISQETDRVLLSAFILPPDLPAEFNFLGAQCFDVAAAFRPAPPNAAVVCREAGRLMFAAYRGDRLVHLQALAAREVDSDLLQELRSAMLVADAHGWTDTMESLELWGTFGGEAVKTLTQAVNMPVRHTPLPCPRLPASPRSLVPRPVQLDRQARVAARRWRMGLTIAAAVYALGVALWAAYVGWLSWERDRLSAKLASEMPTVNEVRSAAQRWESLAPALDRRLYPIEILFRCTELLPATGVRLTLFEIRDAQLEITGEAESARAAYDYLEQVRKSAALDYVAWVEPPPPSPLPNNTAQFRIEGALPSAPGATTADAAP